MKQQIIRIMLLIALAFVLAVGSTGAVSAQTEPVVKAAAPNAPDCRITASTTEPVVGEPVQLTVKTSLTGPVSVYFGDKTPVQNGRNLWHTFHYVGSPVAVASVWVGRSAIECSFDFTVSAAASNQPAVTQTPPAPPVGGNASPIGSGTSAVNTVDGNNNASNAINCNDCTINVNNYPTDQVPPVQTNVPPTAGQDALLNAIANLINWLIK